jgi:hypothetical protein
MRRTLLGVSVGALLLFIAFLLLPSRPDFFRSKGARLANACFIRALKNHAFIIEHHGMRLTAKCIESLTYPDGNRSQPKLMDHHDCTYMYGLVGKSVGDDLMFQVGSTLEYHPWAGAKTIQTADILDIISIEAIK